MKKGYVYILKCSDDSFYTGSTINVEKRIIEHQDGKGANYTQKRLPVTLVFIEAFTSITEAFNREKQIQGWSRAKKQALIDENFDKLPELATCNNKTNFRNYKNNDFDSAQSPKTQ